MKKFYHLVFSLFVVSILALCGCSADTASDAASQPEQSASSDMGFIISFGSLSRASYYTIDEVSYFKVQVSLDSTVVKEKTATFSDTVKIALTKEGLYTITIAAYNSDNTQIADGSAQKWLYHDSGYQRVSISITPYSKTIDVIVDVNWVQPEDTNFDSYSITYHLNGGVNNSSNPSVFMGDDCVYLRNPTYTGYKFCGWYENEDFSGAPINYLYGNRASANVELWAKWKEPNVPFPKEAAVSASGVYTVTLPKEGFDNVWCSNDSQKQFKIVIAPRDVVAKMITGEITDERELLSDENKCYVYANNDVGNAKITTSNLSVDTYLQPVGVSGVEYTGLAVRMDENGNYVVLFDITKMNKDILLARSNIESNEDVWENKDNIESDYVPMILGDVTASDFYPFEMWNAGVAILEPTEEAYPEIINKEPAPTANDVKYICGSLTDWSNVELANGTYEFTYFANRYDDYLSFNFYSEDSDLRMGGAYFASFDENVELARGSGNVMLPTSLLTEGATYVITFTATGDYTATASICAK